MSATLTATSPIVAKDLWKSFGGNEVVKGFELALEPGRATGLIGANGAGKTTVFNLLSGYLPADRGEVTVDGQDVTGKSVHAVARMGVGRSFQEVRLFGSLTAMENAALYAQRGALNSLLATMVLPLRIRRAGREAERAAREALEITGLSALADVPADDLSYAEQKLLSIARLLAMGAHTFLLDEPASGLDKEGIDVVVGSVRRLTDMGRTVMIIEHNLDVVRAVCDTVAFLDQGRVLAHGTADEVFAKPELAEIYFGV
jgi:ABC-type branched-subunit amino acid transport system ATPase component